MIRSERMCVAMMLLSVSGIALNSARGQLNTPKTRKVVFFSAAGSPSGDDYEVIFKSRVESEGYTFVSYLRSDDNGVKSATIENFYHAAKAKDYAMFIIVCHGIKGGLMLEEFADAASRNTALKKYRAKPGYRIPDPDDPDGPTQELWKHTEFGYRLTAGEAGEVLKVPAIKSVPARPEGSIRH